MEIRKKNKLVISFMFLCLFGSICYILLQNHQSRGYSKSIYEESKNLQPVTHSEKWIVLTTISEPTEDVKYLATIPGWKVVVVGDTKTPKNWTHKNCFFLSLQDQKELGFKTYSLLPEKSYSRKNIGYLFAILNGAKVIYETDDDNRPLDKLRKFVLTPKMTGLVYNGNGGTGYTFNPYKHFGQPTIWPRGYPLSSISQNQTSNYLVAEWKTPLIQQGLVNGDPDVDAIFRLTRKYFNSDLNVRFSIRAPAVIVPFTVFSPYNSQNTLHMYDAFWALFIPTTTTARMCDIWRVYWAQRLLWEINGNIGFFPPNAYSKRNRHSYLSDYIKENVMYLETEKLIHFLRAWWCSEKLTFFECVIELTSEMIKRNFLQYTDGHLIRFWISDLQTMKYNEPKRMKKVYVFQNRTDFLKIIESIKQNHRHLPTRVIFNSPDEKPPMIIKSLNKSELTLHKYVRQISKICPSLKLSGSDINRLRRIKVYKNILFLVVFNNPFYKNVKAIETMYRVFFPNIVYCGDNIELFRKETQHLDLRLTFIEAKAERGYFTPRCLVQVIRMNYNFDGYLYVMDDSILNVWTIYSLPQDKFWVSRPNLLLESKSDPYPEYKNPVGLTAYLKGLKEINATDSGRFRYFKRMLEQNTGHKDGFYWVFSDLVYVPTKYAKDLEFVLNIFLRNRLYHEIALPTAIGATDKKENWIFLNGTYLVTHETRELYYEHFSQVKTFFHPMKLSKELFTKKGLSFFCNTYVQLTIVNAR